MPDDELRKVFAERDAAAAQLEATARAAKEAEAQRNREYMRCAGIALLVVALVIGGIWYFNRDGVGNGKTVPDGNGKTVPAELACTLALGGVGVLVAGFTHSKTPAVIFAEVAVPVIGGYACKQAIETLAKSPSTPVDIAVTDGAKTVTKTITLDDLITPPPRPTTVPPGAAPPVNFDRFMYCFRTYNLSTVQYDLCKLGFG